MSIIVTKNDFTRKINVRNLGVAAGFEWLPKKLPNLVTLVKELLRWKEEIRISFKIDSLID